MGGTGAGAVMIGDSITDVATARAAKIPVILLSYGYTPEPVHGLGGDVVIDTFAEVPETVSQFVRGAHNLAV